MSTVVACEREGPAACFGLHKPVAQAAEPETVEEAVKSGIRRVVG
jgi:hypothetical protein